MMNQTEIAKMLYEQKIALSKPIENPDGESAALEHMFRQLQKIGYEYRYVADIELRRNHDIRIMRILHDFLPQMESIYTKETFIRKIDPKRFPDILDYSIDEFTHLSPVDKRYLTGFDEVISKGQKCDAYFQRVSKLLENGDSYAALTDVRKMLCKNRPDLIFPFTQSYSQGVLLPSTFADSVFDPSPETTEQLNQYCNISKDEVTAIIGCYNYQTNQYRYSLSVTAFEYWKPVCTAENIRAIAYKTLKKRSKYLNL